MASLNAAARTPDGRFAPGHAGNPEGKRPGTRNRATVLREGLRDGEASARVRLIVEKALKGYAVSARFFTVASAALRSAKISSIRCSGS